MVTKEQDIAVLWERLYDEIYLFKASISKEAGYAETKKIYFKLKETFRELQQLVPEYQMNLQELIDRFDNSN